MTTLDQSQPHAMNNLPFVDVFNPTHIDFGILNVQFFFPHFGIILGIYIFILY